MRSIGSTEGTARRIILCIYFPALPSRLVKLADTELKYVIVAIGGFVEPLERLAAYKPGGRPALQIFNDDILPKL